MPLKLANGFTVCARVVTPEKFAKKNYEQNCQKAHHTPHMILTSSLQPNLRPPLRHYRPELPIGVFHRSDEQYQLEKISSTEIFKSRRVIAAYWHTIYIPSFIPLILLCHCTTPKFDMFGHQVHMTTCIDTRNNYDALTCISFTTNGHTGTMSIQEDARDFQNRLGPVSLLQH